MAPHTRTYWLHALTPLHVGAGFGTGFIDLPIMREKVTNWPIVPGSTVKGVLADHWGARAAVREGDAQVAFGRPGVEESSAGALVFTDARLACLPIASLYGTFAWLTCPLLLRRLSRDLAAAGLAAGLPEPWSVPPGKVDLPKNSLLKAANGQVFFTELDFAGQENSQASLWADKFAAWLFPSDPAWQPEFKQRFAVLADDAFNFLSVTGTEVNARVRLKPEQKTVERGGLWYEECLPAETILAGLVWCDRGVEKTSLAAEQLLAKYCLPTLHLQIGGKATIGRGQVRLVTTSPAGARP